MQFINLPFVDCDKSELQACGSKFKKTSPSKPPTAKLSKIRSDFDSAAEIINEYIKNYSLKYSMNEGWPIVAPNFNDKRAPPPSAFESASSL